jgi:hypothetical protein
VDLVARELEVGNQIEAVVNGCHFGQYSNLRSYHTASRP